MDKIQVGRFIRKARDMRQDHELSEGEIDRLAREIKEERVEEMAEAFTRAATRLANRWVLKLGWIVAGLALIGLFVVLIMIGGGHWLRKFLE
jgi:hypothetical protein